MAADMTVTSINGQRVSQLIYSNNANSTGFWYWDGTIGYELLVVLKLSFKLDLFYCNWWYNSKNTYIVVQYFSGAYPVRLLQQMTTITNADFGGNTGDGGSAVTWPIFLPQQYTFRQEYVVINTAIWW